MYPLLLECRVQLYLALHSCYPPHCAKQVRHTAVHIFAAKWPEAFTNVGARIDQKESSTIRCRETRYAPMRQRHNLLGPVIFWIMLPPCIKKCTGPVEFRIMIFVSNQRIHRLIAACYTISDIKLAHKQFAPQKPQELPDNRAQTAHTGTRTLIVAAEGSQHGFHEKSIHHFAKSEIQNIFLAV